MWYGRRVVRTETAIGLTNGSHSTNQTYTGCVNGERLGLCTRRGARDTPPPYIHTRTHMYSYMQRTYAAKSPITTQIYKCHKICTKKQ